MHPRRIACGLELETSLLERLEMEMRIDVCQNDLGNYPERQDGREGVRGK